MIIPSELQYTLMKNIFLIFVLILSSQIELKAQTVFELNSNQSMLMFGKGPGQDATINPFEGEDCYAVIKNIGNESFSARVQQKGKIIEILPVYPNQTKKVKLLVGDELYLDYENQNKAKASIEYEKISHK